MTAAALLVVLGAASLMEAAGLSMAMGAAALLGSTRMLGAQAAPGEEGPFLIKGGTVVNPGGQRLPNTDILIRNNRIVAIGAGGGLHPADLRTSAATRQCCRGH